MDIISSAKKRARSIWDAQPTVFDAAPQPATVYADDERPPPVVAVAPARGDVASAEEFSGDPTPEQWNKGITMAKVREDAEAGAAPLQGSAVIVKSGGKYHVVPVLGTGESATNDAIAAFGAGNLEPTASFHDEGAAKKYLGIKPPPLSPAPPKMAPTGSVVVPPLVASNGENADADKDARHTLGMLKGVPLAPLSPAPPQSAPIIVMPNGSEIKAPTPEQFEKMYGPGDYATRVRDYAAQYGAKVKATTYAVPPLGDSPGTWDPKTGKFKSVSVPVAAAGAKKGGG